jgi:hypothetical protein
MRVKRFMYSVLMALGALGSAPVPLYAEGRGKVECPPVVAHGPTGSYMAATKRNFSFQCFESVSEAKRAGFIESTRQSKLDLSAWWRLALRMKENTCPDTETFRTSAPVTVFLQLRQADGALFGEVCPSPYRYVGTRLSDGAVLSATESISDDPFCPDGLAESTFIIEFSNVTKRGAKTARYKRIKRCLSGDATPSTCTSEWVGEAFRETSHKFPTVPSNVNLFASACEVTRQTCKDCHGG